MNQLTPILSPAAPSAVRSFLKLLLLASGGIALADGPKDNIPSNVRPIPPPGVEIPAADSEALTKGAAELKTMIEDLKKQGGRSGKREAKNSSLLTPHSSLLTPHSSLLTSDFSLLLPDVEIFHKSVDWALRHNQFNNVREVKAAYEQLAEGKKRAAALKNGDAPWTRQKGLVVRAYRSKIDGSVQPYGMVIPESYTGGAPARLDFWIHGRGETLSELAFVDQRMKSPGQIQPKDALVLHPYGRYCCANKFAGEVDLFEALEHAKKFYRIDDDRIMMRGFSMGGAAAWQFGTHFASRWCAVNPGAGFAETPEFLGGFQSEDVSGAPWYQKTLWHLYNATDYALNLFNVPTIAYSGEIDKQKQAADVMERELQKEGLNLLHLIGPQTAHKIHPDSLAEIEQRLADVAAVGRERTLREIHFNTWTLRYNEMGWLRIDAMEEEWKKARVDVILVDVFDETTPPTGPSDETKISLSPSYPNVRLNTDNVTALTFDFRAGHCPIAVKSKLAVKFNDEMPFWAKGPKSDRSWLVHLRRVDGKWQEVGSAEQPGLHKRHGLQGPIDDAFWDAFLFVAPTGPALNPAVGKWVGSELPRAVREWQRQFRGDAPQRKDTEINDEDIAKNNLILWGDPGSNAVLKRIADKLPIKWTADGIEVGAKKFSAGEHVPLFIHPNPLNPQRYVVLNSGFTYREYDYLNNARQVPKLPDWAIVNLSEPPNAVSPGKIVAADFFDEEWKLKPVNK